MKRFVRKLEQHLEPSEWGPPMFPAGWPSPPLVEIPRMQAAGIDKVGIRLHPLMMNAVPQPSRHLSRDKHGHETTTATTLADRLPIRIMLSWICIASFLPTFDGAKIEFLFKRLFVFFITTSKISPHSLQCVFLLLL